MVPVMKIYHDAFGEPKDPTVLLIIGMDEQCTGWLPYIYEPIVEAGFHVIRFDNRDCGLSEWIEDWDESQPYSLEDMAQDAVGLLDALGIQEAHIVGASMGGMTAQRIAISHPHRTRTLTSIASSAFPLDPDPEVQPSIDVARFQGIHEELVARFPDHLTVPAETIEFRGSPRTPGPRRQVRRPHNGRKARLDGGSRSRTARRHHAPGAQGNVGSVPL